MNDIEQEDINEMASKASAAQQAISSPIFNEAFQMMNQGIVEQIIQTPPEATLERERLYSMYKAGQLFVQQFATLINNLELRQQPTGE
jgi:hypothetical protein